MALILGDPLQQNTWTEERLDLIKTEQFTRRYVQGVVETVTFRRLPAHGAIQMTVSIAIWDCLNLSWASSMLISTWWPQKLFVLTNPFNLSTTHKGGESICGNSVMERSAKNSNQTIRMLLRVIGLCL